MRKKSKTEYHRRLCSKLAVVISETATIVKREHKPLISASYLMQNLGVKSVVMCAVHVHMAGEQFELCI